MTLQERRIARLKREIALLEAIDDRLWRKIRWLGFGVIPLVASVGFVILRELQTFSGSIVLPILASIVFAAVFWWFFRYSTNLLLFIVLLPLVIAVGVILAVLTCGLIADAGRLEMPETKENRKAKIDRAIARRRKLLGWLDDSA